MITVLFVSERGEGYAIATKIAGERNISKFYIHSKRHQDIGQGLKEVQRIESIRNVESYDLIFASPRIFDRGDFMGPAGRVFGGESLGSLLMSGVYRGSVKSLLSRGEVPEEKAIRITLGGWIVDRKWKAFNLIFNNRRLMEGEKGPLTDGVGCVSRFIPKCTLTQQILGSLTDILFDSSYNGYIEVEVDLFERNIQLVDINTYLSNGNLESLSESILAPLSEALYFNDFKTGTDWNIAVGMSVYPWPNAGESFVEDDAIEIPPSARKHVWMNGVTGIGLSRSSSFLGYATARGKYLYEAKNRVYRTIKNIVRSPEVQYRSDVGAQVDAKYELLTTWGYLT